MVFVAPFSKDRNDLSSFIAHFTRDGGVHGNARDNLVNILTTGCLMARSEQGMAKNRHFPGQAVVCFTEVPPEGYWTMVQPTWGRQVQLRPYGVAFRKQWAREKDANPVWYVDATPGRNWLTNDIKEMINSATVGEEASGILRLTPFFEPMGDWRATGGTVREFSWEREWRKVGNLNFALVDLVGVLAPTNEHPHIKAAIAGMQGADSVSFYDPTQGLTEQR